MFDCIILPWLVPSTTSPLISPVLNVEKKLTQQAIKLYWILTVGHPTDINPSLAMGSQQPFFCLSELGCQGEVLYTIQQTVAILLL
jgi:hypothetical protein